MGQLAYEIRTHRWVNSRDLANLMFEVYGRRINIAAQWELSRGSWLHLETNEDEEFEDYEIEEIADFKAGIPSYVGIDTIFKDMAKEGYIEPGRYIVDISW